MVIIVTQQLTGDLGQDASGRDDAGEGDAGKDFPREPGLDTLLGGDLRVTGLVVLVGLLLVYLVHRTFRLRR